MAKRISIGQLSFPSQKAALDFIRAIRDRYRDGERIAEEDEEFLHELLLLHPEAADKIGLGVRGFTVATEQEFGRTRHFVAIRTDGSSTDFSFKSCVVGADPRRDRLQAMRVAVAEQVAAFKTDAFSGRDTVLCAVRGIPTTFADADVDHMPPNTFATLVERWLLNERLQLDDLSISPPADNQVVSRLIDDVQLRSWQSFHRQHAKLRITCRAANLSDVRRQ